VAIWPGRTAVPSAPSVLPAIRSANLPSFRLGGPLSAFSGVEFLELPQDLVAALDGVIHRLLRLLLAGEHRFHLVALRQHRLHEITEAEPARIVVGRAAGELQYRDLAGRMLLVVAALARQRIGLAGRRHVTGR